MRGDGVTDFNCYEVVIDGYTVKMCSEDDLTADEQRSIALAAMDQAICFNDVECRSWFFDFKLEGRWIGSMGIEAKEMTIRVDAREEERAEAAGIVEGKRPIAAPEDEKGAWEEAVEEKHA